MRTVDLPDHIPASHPAYFALTVLQQGGGILYLQHEGPPVPIPIRPRDIRAVALMMALHMHYEDPATRVVGAALTNGKLAEALGLLPKQKAAARKRMERIRWDIGHAARNTPNPEVFKNAFVSSPWHGYGIHPLCRVSIEYESPAIDPRPVQAT